MACTSACAKTAFAALPKEAVSAIKDLALAANTALNLLKLSKQSMTLNIDVALAPLQIKRDIISGAISGIREKTHIIPTTTIAKCPDLGAINTLLEVAIVGQLEAVSNLVFDIDSLTASKASVIAEISQIDTAIEFFTNMTECLNEVLNG